MTSSYKNRTTKIISQLFADAKKYAKEDGTKKRSIIFIDEFDSIAMARDKGGSMDVVTQLLQEMDGFGDNSSVSVIAATNYPWMIDDAILSRFSQKIFCDLPSHDAVVDIMQKYLAKKLFVPKLICDPSGNGLKTVNEILKKQISEACGTELELKLFDSNKIDCENTENKSQYFYALFGEKELKELANGFVTTEDTFNKIKEIRVAKSTEEKKINV